MLKLGQVQVAKGSADQAIATYQQSIKDNPREASFYILMGELYEAKQDYRVLLERIENHEGRQAESFALDDSGLKRTLRDGDLLRVYPLSPRFDNAVTLRGNVGQPGRYAWHDGMRVSDLIPNRQFLLTRDYWNQQNFLVPERIAHPFGLAPEPVQSPNGDQCADPNQRAERGINPQNDFNAQNGFNQQPGTNQQSGTNSQTSPANRTDSNERSIREQYAERAQSADRNESAKREQSTERGQVSRRRSIRKTRPFSAAKPVSLQPGTAKRSTGTTRRSSGSTSTI